MPSASPQPDQPGPARQRLGLFGGSFDPVHNGHLTLAAACLEEARLDAVWFIPAAIQPHKPTGPVASNEDRLLMLKRAIAGHAGFGVSTLEFDRGGVSYTVDTLHDVRQRAPDAELFLLMGADTLHDLPNWWEPAEVLRLATPLVVQRPGEAVANGATAAPHFIRVRMPPIDVSSSQVRRRVAGNESIDTLVPRAVADVIAERGLYRRPPVEARDA
ncbi:MAG: nicotinate-nucleotide adenylyltransferase [Planctomycetota bacterium]